MDDATRELIAKEARRQELRAKVSQLQGIVVEVGAAANALNAAAVSITDQITRRSRELDAAKTELGELEAGLGPGLTSDFGQYSSTDQSLRAERFAGKQGAVDFIKENPECSEDDAVQAYSAAALAATGRDFVVQDPVALRRWYASILVSYGFIPDDSWESWRAWVVATPREAILGMT